MTRPNPRFSSLQLLTVLFLALLLVHCGGTKSDLQPAPAPTSGGGPSNNPSPAPSSAPLGIYTSRYDLGRTGLNDRETILTPANVGSLAKLKETVLDGAIFTQPLYVPQVAIPGNGTHNVVYVATEHDSLYAIDADNGAVLWKRSFIDPGNGVTTLADDFNTGRTGLGAEVGITGTPVIDPTKNLLYVAVMTVNKGAPQWTLHGVSTQTGADSLTPVMYQGSIQGTGTGAVAGTITFDPKIHNQRMGLALANNVIYTAFASYSDFGNYHGWVFAHDANTLQMLDVFNASPDGEGTGIWSAGTAPALDGDGNLYVVTGDGHSFNADQGGRNYGDSVVKLKLANGKFTVVDFFTPYNQHCLDQMDIDFGASGVMLVPGNNQIVLGSKEGRIYLLDRTNMGKFHPGGDTQILDWKLINAQSCEGSGGGFLAGESSRMYGSASFWNGNVYLGGVRGPLRTYQTGTGKLVAGAVTPTIFEGSGQLGRGPMSTVSANGTSNGLVWAVSRKVTGTPVQLQTLHAYDATNISKELYSSDWNPGRDRLPISGTVFNLPVVINGKVYVISTHSLFIYGLP